MLFVQAILVLAKGSEHRAGSDLAAFASADHAFELGLERLQLGQPAANLVKLATCNLVNQDALPALPLRRETPDPLHDV